MDLERLSQQIFKFKAVLFAVCIILVVFRLDEKAQALGIALAFMALSSIGDIVLGYYKSKAGLGFVSSLVIPVIMFAVFLFLAVFVLLNALKHDPV